MLEFTYQEPIMSKNPQKNGPPGPGGPQPGGPGGPPGPPGPPGPITN